MLNKKLMPAIKRPSQSVMETAMAMNPDILAGMWQRLQKLNTYLSVIVTRGLIR